MKYLITGGAGFIGSNLAEELVSQNHQVIIVDNLTTGSLNNIAKIKDKITFLRANAADVLTLEQLSGINGIYHLGIPSTTLLYRNNPMLVGKAINEFIAILELAKKKNAKLFMPLPLRFITAISRHFAKICRCLSKIFILRRAIWWKDWHSFTMIFTKFNL